MFCDTLHEYGDHWNKKATALGARKKEGKPYIVVRDVELLDHFCGVWRGSLTRIRSADGVYCGVGGMLQIWRCL